MLDDIFEEIRHFLQEGAQADPDLVGEVLADYGREVEAVNRRLREVHALLKKGLRPDALDLVERAPSLREALDQLLQPEDADWRNLLVTLNLPAPAKLRLDLAEEMEQAYDETQQVDHLLKRHRRLAITRAPLSERIEILRAIRQKDPINPAWREDIEAWEKVRIKQIESEIEAAAKQGDVATIERVHKESERPWSIEFPPALRSRIAIARRSQTAQQARDELRALSQELNAALAAFEVERGQRARQRWNEVFPAAEISESDPLAQSASEPLAWLHEEDIRQAVDSEFQAAVASVEQAVEDRIPLAELDRRVYAATRLERELPAALAIRVSRYRDSLVTTGSRRFRLQLSVVVLTLLAAAAFLTYALVSTQKRQLLRDAVERLNGLRDSGQFVEAEAFLDHLDEPLRMQAVVQQVITEIRQLKDQEQLRSSQFEDAYQRMVASVEQSPRPEGLKHLTSLARTDDEKAKVQQLEAAIRRRQNELQSKLSSEFNDGVLQFADALKAIEGEEDLAARSEKARALLSEMSAWKERFIGNRNDPWTILPSQIMQPLDPLMKRAEGLIDEHRVAQANARARDEVTRGVANTPSYIRALQGYQEQLKNTPTGAELAATLSESDVWAEFDQWKSLASRREWTRLANADVNMLQQLLATGQAIQKNSAALHIASAFDDVRDVLLHYIKNAHEDTALDREEIASFFDKLLMSQLFVVHQAPDRFNYSTERPNITPERVSTLHFPSIAMARRESLAIPANLVVYAGEAPHCILARHLAKNIRQAQAPLGQTLKDALKTLAEYKKEGLDPIPVVIMTEWLFEQASEHDTDFATRATALKKRIEDLKLANRDWFDAKDPEIARVRRISGDIHESLLPLVQAVQPAGQSADVVVRKWREMAAFRLIGWLDREPSGSWHVRTVSPAPNLDVYCLTLSTQQAGQWSMRPCGRIENGKLMDIDSAVVQLGRPVYARLR